MAAPTAPAGAPVQVLDRGHLLVEQAVGRFGHSKDYRGVLPQVVMPWHGMAVTWAGVPMLCWTCPGNAADTSIIRTVR